MREVCPSCKTVDRMEKITEEGEVTFGEKKIKVDYIFHRCKECQVQFSYLQEDPDPIYEAYKAYCRDMCISFDEFKKGAKVDLKVVDTSGLSDYAEPGESPR